VTRAGPQPDAPSVQRTTTRPASPPWALVTLGGFTALLVWSRCAHLTTSLWQDEARPIYAYIWGGPREILFGTYGIDNHLAFELVAWALTRVLGTSEVAYRLGSLLPALASVVWLAAWLLRRFGAAAAIVFTALITFSPFHLDLAPQARGYGLTFLAIAGMTVFGDTYLRNHERRHLWLFVAAGVLGACSFPLFVLPFAVAGGWLFLVSPGLRRRDVALAMVAGGIGVLLIMANAIPQLLSSAGDFQHHRRLVPLGWGENVLWPLRLLGPTFALNNGTTPEIRVAVWDPTRWELVATSLLVYPALGLGCWALANRQQWQLLGLLVLPIAGTYLTMTARHSALWPRYTSYFLYPAAILVAVGVHALWQRLDRRWALVALAAGTGVLLVPVARSFDALGVAVLVLVALAAVVALVVGNGGLELVRRALPAGAVVCAIPLVTGLVAVTGALDSPLREDWKQVAELAPDAQDGFFGMARMTAGSYYYLGAPDASLRALNSTDRQRVYDSTDFVDEGEMQDRLCNAPPPVVWIETGAQRGIVDLGCLVAKGAEKTTVPILLFHGNIDVWRLSAD
jgi:hypothetical protein